ncbi:MAG: hypothetical protein LBT04_06730 [Prevotellaceae bacterium]|jgi:C-terminal processing protease CtpA/Prc|nr:hypothetical protein [Prevotellaceae bacterium]
MDFTEGIILDIRNNGGGYFNYMYNTASLFYAGEKTLLYTSYKNGKGHGDFSEPKSYEQKGKAFIANTVPVVILTGRYTYSAANLFAFVMNDLPNSVLIGERTGGGGGPITCVTLPNGWILQYPFEKTYSTTRHKHGIWH